MEFNWINVFGAVVVCLLLLPNIVYAIKNKNEKNLCENRLMNVSEQIGRYACIVLMWLPLPVWKFGFGSETAMALYLAGNALLLSAYWAVFALYLKKRTAARALATAVLPACIFFISGITLRHWLLVGFAVLFGVAHVYVTVQNTRAARKTT
jgi:hypothetical protein